MIIFHGRCFDERLLVIGRWESCEFFLCICNAFLVAIATSIAQNTYAIVNIQSGVILSFAESQVWIRFGDQSQIVFL